MIATAIGEGRSEEVATGILRVEAPLGERVNALYVLIGRDALLVLDTGTVSDPPGALATALAQRTLDPGSIRYVLDTHADVDHMGGNRAMRVLAPRALLACGEPDRAMIEDVELMIAERYGEFSADHGIPVEPAMAEWCRTVAQDTPIDVGLVGGERIRLDEGWCVEVVALPGHSSGSIGLWDPRSRALLSGDAVLGQAVVAADGRPEFPPTYRYVDAYLATIGAISRLGAATLLASHEPLMRGGDVARYLDASRDFVERTDREVRAALRRGPWTLADLALELGPRLGDWPAEAHPVMRFPLLGHLERLVARGEAIVERIDGRLAYQTRAS